MLDQATAAEKMAASMSKINELTTALGAMFAPIVNMFASVAGFIMESKLAMIILSTAIGGLVSIMSVLAIKSLISIAGTNLFDKNKKSESSPQSSQVKIDMGPTNALLQQLINVISAGGDVMLDGQKVGQALNLVAYKTQ
jgi:hypothetical protein